MDRPGKAGDHCPVHPRSTSVLTALTFVNSKILSQTIFASFLVLNLTVAAFIVAIFTGRRDFGDPEPEGGHQLLNRYKF